MGPVEQEDWRERALCREEDPETFFPVGRSDSAGYRITEAEALAICRRCPVLADCREWTIETRQAYGVSGGLGEDERRELISSDARRKRRQRAPEKV